MPSIKDQSTVEAIARHFTGDCKRNKEETMRTMGYAESSCRSGKCINSIYANIRVKRAIAKIDGANQAKREHNTQIAIDNLYADYARLEESADSGNIAAINARTSIMRELDCINGLQQQVNIQKGDGLNINISEAKTYPRAVEKKGA